MSAPTHGRDEFVSRAPISPESLSDYDRWGRLLSKWNAKINLVAPSTLPDFWIRHALDSAQIVPHIPDVARTIVDFGSGAGFPGLSIAIEAKHNPSRDQHVHLIESAGKKASFIRTVIRELDLPATVHSQRIEAMEPLGADVITARAFAPLSRLFPMAEHHLRGGGQLILLKGADLSSEEDAVASDWVYERQTTASLSGSDGVVVAFMGLGRR